MNVININKDCKTTKKRIISYDILRVLAIFMVVAIHTNVSFINNERGTTDWLLTVGFTSIFTVSVPIFFMISGAMLLDVEKPLSFSQLFKTRILKIFIPFIIWSLLYICARVITGKLPFNFETFLSIWNEPAYYQFWFIYTLLAIYLILPLLQIFIINAEKKYLEYAVVIWIIFNLTLPLLERINPSITLCSHFDLVFVEGYLGYFILGYYLKKYPPVKKVKLSLFIALAAIVLTGILTYLEWFYYKDNWQGFFMQSYLTPFAAFGASGLFLTFQNIEIKNTNIICCLAAKLFNLTFGIYFIHYFIIIFLEYTGLLSGSSFIILLLKICAVSLISSLITYIMSRFKFLRKYLLGLN